MVYDAGMKQMLSERVYTTIRDEILSGVFAPGVALKPQELAGAYGVSLAVVREALVRLVGDGLADRLTNRGFAVPTPSDQRWQDLAEARATFEPAVLRLSIERGDVEWESRVRAAHHRLARTPAYEKSAWTTAHREFHRALLDGCGNAIMLETFDRLWVASELIRVWATDLAPPRDHVGEHRALEEAALAGEADLAAELLARHVSLTAAGLVG
ncbi:GntR family transcriptional regulator [Actinoplanes sp. NPDC020271]|uniref:GntR family transcriptional regulator n=1 Tax=Actinoplanes sp. NPDC020271 TaxID=3363896 RepID=UPI0037A68BF5